MGNSTDDVVFCVQDKHGNSYDNVFTHAGVSLFISTLVRAIRMMTAPVLFITGSNNLVRAAQVSFFFNACTGNWTDVVFF
jgi:hypothetical protein